MEKRKTTKILTPEEKWERADLTDTFIFYKVMTENPDACRRLLETLLHIAIQKIEILGEESFGIDSDSKGIRLDVYAKDEKRVFDVEMQVTDTKELPERARYYQGVMDVDQLKSGEPYRALKESHVIFICMKDIFKKGFARYTFENICLEDTKIKLEDRSVKHFFVAENYDKIKDDIELRAFLKMIETGKTEDTYTKQLERFIKKAKQNAQTRRLYMEWDRALNYARETGYDTGYGTGYDTGYGTGYDTGYDSGYDSGFGTGLQKKAFDAAENLIRAGLGSIQQISEVTGLSVSEVEKIKDGLACVK